MLDARTTIIHGVPYGAPEWTGTAAAGAHFIRSPSSNLVLYGATADSQARWPLASMSPWGPACNTWGPRDGD
jgi:hypothetical protein